MVGQAAAPCLAHALRSEAARAIGPAALAAKTAGRAANAYCASESTGDAEPLNTSARGPGTGGRLHAWYDDDPDPYAPVSGTTPLELWARLSQLLCLTDLQASHTVLQTGVQVGAMLHDALHYPFVGLA